MSKPLTELRHQIDELDDQLLQILAARFAIVLKIGKIKQEQQLPPLDEKRWIQVLNDKLTKAQQINLSTDFVEKLYTIIHEYALRIERDTQ